MSIKQSLFFIIIAFLCNHLNAQTVFNTANITNFYQAFDSVLATNDESQQINFIQQLYLNKADEGLKYTIAHSLDNNKVATAADWLQYIKNAKTKLQGIRPYMENIDAQKLILEKKFTYFKKQYPAFKDGNVYFVIGLGVFGGRPEGNNLFIGCEVVANSKPDWAVSIVLHEFVHTFQKRTYNALLAHCLNEGACDFIAETINQKSLREIFPNGYIDFGYKNEAEVWKEFKKYIASNTKGQYFDWLYGLNGRTVNGTRLNDLGYFVGYIICKAYYDKAANKQQAIKDIIEMDVSTDELAKAFLIKSGYASATDAKFIRKFKFDKVSENKKKIKLVQYGYTIKNGNVVFTFTAPKSMQASEIKYVTIAGNFNGWNPNDLNYKMTSTSNLVYTYIIPVQAFKEKNNEFKFVINGEAWQTIPENTKNVNNGNLSLIIK
jgi:hypothetical protein